MVCNFTGMLSAPNIDMLPTYMATYSSGFGFVHKEIEAPNRAVAYAIASRRPPEGHQLTGLRKKKAPRLEPRPSLAERVDVDLTRALYGIYANTDAAARFAMAEITASANQSLNQTARTI